MGLRGTQPMGSIIYTLVSSPRDSTRITDLGRISNLQIFDLVNLSTSYSSCIQTWIIFIIFISQGVLMNKPDNSDRTRGQLTAGIDTCHLLQIQSPWTWIRETGQTHSFAVFRNYKERVLVVLRVPSASTGIFFASLTRISTSRAHSCAYTRPHRTDPGAYLHDIFQSWHSNFVAMTQLKNHISQPCLTIRMCKIFGFAIF
jgi:hypothetical protein